MERRGVIAPCHWKLTIGKLHSGAMWSYHVATLSMTWKFSATCQYYGAILEIDNCHLSYLRDALKAQVKHCLTKNTLTLRPCVVFWRIIYRWKDYSISHMIGSENYGNTICIRMNSYFKASSNILEMIFKLRKSTGITTLLVIMNYVRPNFPCGIRW